MIGDAVRATFNYKKMYNDISRNQVGLRLISREEKEELKNCMFNMAVDLDTRCRKHDINLFLVGGSLLGAVRHGGFIPWDDDMDFALARRDYEKLKKVFDEEFSDSYELRCPNSGLPSGGRYMQIFKKDTVLKTGGSENPFLPQSVYIDVFPCDHVPDNAIYRVYKGICANALMLISSCVMERSCEKLDLTGVGLNEKIFLFIRTVIGTVFSFLRPQKWFDILDRFVQYDGSSSLTTLAMGRKHYLGEVCPAGVFFPLKEMSFEGHVFYAPADSDHYLRNLYGDDYMIPPKETERESHYIIELNTGSNG